MERIDKILALELNMSRADAKSLIKKGGVAVNGVKINNCSVKVDEKCDRISVGSNEIRYNKFVYIMMNKPKGIVSAALDKNDMTVIDILPENMKRKNLFPAGRLDKDTTGFALITDDGDFAHNILSPKNHIPKTYIAFLDKPFDESVKFEFERGTELNGRMCMPAEISAVDGDRTKAKVTIKQGMYHQIKRMFKKFGLTVLELERIQMGLLPLDKDLAQGECRYLTDEEVKRIRQKEKNCD